MDFQIMDVCVAIMTIPFYTFLGAFVLYVLHRLQGNQPFSLFTAININTGPTASFLVLLLDIIASSALGSLVVIPLTSPTTVPQAVVAGLGMTGILSSHVAGKKTTRKGP